MNKTLFKAAQLIEQRGWCQHIAQDDNGAICMGQAIALAQHKHWATDKYNYGLLDLGVNLSIDYYNDIRCESIEQAIDVLVAEAFMLDK